MTRKSTSNALVVARSIPNAEKRRIHRETWLTRRVRREREQKKPDEVR